MRNTNTERKAYKIKRHKTKKMTMALLRKYLVGMTLLLGFTACGTDDVEDIISDALSLDKTIEVNVSVASENQTLSTLVVQTLAGIDTLTADSNIIKIKVFDNDKPQIIAITDTNDNLLMMYRAPVTNGQNIVIDAESTTRALVTFSPLFGPVKSDEYDEMIAIITSMSSYPDFQNAVTRAILHGYDLTDTVNAEVVAKLYNLFRELCEIAYQNYGAQQTKSKDVDINAYIDCWPIVASTSSNTLTLRAYRQIPSYYGELRDGNSGVWIQDVCVPSRAAYGFLDMFTHTASNFSYGEPVNISFENEGNYLFHLSRTNAQATADFYLHLVNNILGALGADLKDQEIQSLSNIIGIVVGRMIEASEFQFDNITPNMVMDVIGMAYTETVKYLADIGQNTGRFENWQLAGAGLKKLSTFYNVVKNATDAVLRITYAMQNIPKEIDFCVNYTTEHGIQPCQNVSIAIASGNNQIGPAWCVLQEPLGVTVSTRAENGLYIQQAQKVRFTVVQGNGNIINNVITTDEYGRGEVFWALGSGRSGVVQSVEAVAIDDDGNEISNTVTFNAMVSNTRWQITKRCSWAEGDNYICKFDVDIAMSSSATGNVDLVTWLMVQGWDYDGKPLYYNFRGTYNTETYEVDIYIDGYTAHINNGGYRFRTDRFTTILQGTDITNIPGTLIYDNGAGCQNKLDMHMWGSSSGYSSIQPAIGNRVPEGIPEEHRTDKRTINQQ